MVASKLAQLPRVVAHEGKEKILIEVFDKIGARISVVKKNSTPNSPIDKRRILQDKSIPRGLLAFQAADNEVLFLVGSFRSRLR
jgi:hypothetical protein